MKLEKWFPSKNELAEKIVIAKKERGSLLTSMLSVYKLKRLLEKLIFARRVAFGNGVT